MGKKAAVGLIIIIGVAGGIAGWYFFLRPKGADYSGLLLLPLLLPELPTPPVKVDSSIVADLKHGVGIFVGDYTLKNFDSSIVPTFPDFEIPLLGTLKVQNTTLVTNPISVTGSFTYINLFEDASLTMTNVSYPNLEINCFGDSVLLVDNCTIGAIYARENSKVTVKNSTVGAIYDADLTTLTVYEVLDVEFEGITSKIKILNNTMVSTVIIKAGADAEIDSSIIGYMLAESPESDKPAILNITGSTIGSNITLGASTDATLNAVVVAQTLRLEADAIGRVTSLTATLVEVVQGAQCLLINSVVGTLNYGIVCAALTTTVNAFVATGAGYQNNTVLAGTTTIPEINKHLVSVLAINNAIANIINCPGLDSVMAANFGNVSMSYSLAIYVIGKDSSIFNIQLSSIITLVTFDQSNVTMDQVTVIGTTISVSIGGTSIGFPVGIITSDNSIVNMQNSTAYALTGGDSSQLYLDNITINLLLDIETTGIVQVTNTLGGNTILALEVGIGTQGGPVGNVLIQGAKIAQATVKGSAVTSFVTCDFSTGILLEGIIVSSGTVLLTAGVQTSGTSSNYTTLDGATKASLITGLNRFIGYVEVNNSAILNMVNYQWSTPIGISAVNVSIDMYHNSQANLQNASLGLVFMFNSSSANMANCTIQPPITALYALVVVHEASVQCSLGTIITLFLVGRENAQSAYSITCSNSILGLGFVVGYAKIQCTTCSVGIVECVAGADTLAYAVELLAGTQASQVNARSWGPLA